MSSVFKKEHALERRQKEIDRKLAVVNGRIRTLIREAGRAGLAVPKAPSALDREYRDISRAERGGKMRTGSPARNAAKAEKPLAQSSGEKAKPHRDTRFSDYLASSLESDGYSRHERRTQKNRAIVMLGVVLCALLWALYWLLF